MEFVEFCKAAGIRCEEVSAAKYFNPGMCDGAFLTEEYTYDAKILGAYYQEQLEKQKISKFSTVPELTGSQRQENHL